jgi:hypothetical protein
VWFGPLVRNVTGIKYSFYRDEKDKAKQACEGDWRGAHDERMFYFVIGMPTHWNCMLNTGPAGWIMRWDASLSSLKRFYTSTGPFSSPHQ